MKRSVTWVGALLLGGLLAFSPLASRPAAAAVSLSVTPITWDIVGLDSNSPAAGPYRFPVGARVCASGGTASTVTAELAWDSANANISLRPGSLASLDLGSLASGDCADAYFEAEVTRTAAAYDTTRAYHISATDSGSGAAAQTPRPRQLYVERLISQNRNGITSVKLDGTSIPAGGGMTLVVGRTYDIELAGYTATQGYNQLEAFMTLPNTIFQVLGVDTTYSADSSPFVDSPDDRLYADACGWDSDPGSPNYRSCVGGDAKAGGTVVTTYHVRVVAGAGTSQTLTSLLYDFSGSSYHYNADAGVGARIATIVGPEQVTIAKAFAPKGIAPGSTSTLTFTVANPTSETFTGVRFTDSFPTGMAVAGSPGVTTSGCGAGAFVPALVGGETSISFSGATLAANGECQVGVTVTAPAGTYPNTTGHLFVDTGTDTGNTASDTLVAQAVAACVPGQTLAAWTVPDGTTANPPDLPGGLPTTQSPAVLTATASAADAARTAILTTLGQGDTTSWSTYGYKDLGQTIDFVVDTRRYTAVTMDFHVANPTPSNGPTQFLVSTSTGGPFTTRLTVNSPAAVFTRHTLDLTGFTSTTGTTTFRITASGAKNDNSAANLVLDSIGFTGCGEPVPAPTITKAFAPDPIPVGGPSTLTFTIANTASGSVALTGVAVSDVLPEGLTVTGGSSAACGGTLTRTAATRTVELTGGSLAAGASCAFDITVTGATAGLHQNVTGFLATNEGGTSTSYASDSLLVVAPPVFAKAFAPVAIRTGATTDLTFAITNPNRTAGLSGIAFTDALPAGVTVATSGPAAACGGSLTTTAPSTIAFTGGTLAANDACTITVTVTGATAGIKDNSTSPITSAEGGTGAPAAASLAVTDLAATIELNKQVSTDGTTWRKFVAVAAGDDVFYRFGVYNAGDVPFSSVAVIDGGPVACSWTGASYPPLAPGDTIFCETGPVPAVEGVQTNTAHATGLSVLGASISADSTAAYATAALTIVKSAGETSFESAGDILHYTFVVTNAGDAPLAGPVTVADDKATDETCPAVGTVGDGDGWFDPGEELTCTATYTITAADVLAGSVTNTASAVAGGFASNSDLATVRLRNPALALAKASTTTSVTAAGQTVPYAITATNTGTTVLTGLAVDDPACDAGPVYVSGDTGADDVFGPGEAWLFTCDRTVTQAELDAGGDLSNTATADTAETGPASATLDIPVVGDPALAIVKTLTGADYFTKVGDVLTYQYVVTNTGNITIPGPITVTDNRTEVTCPSVTDLPPDASITCTSEDAVTEEDLTAGVVTNTARASATVGQEIVRSTEVAVSAQRVIPPSAPPSTVEDDVSGATGPGWGLIGALAVIGTGLLAAALVLGPARRRRRRAA